MTDTPIEPALTPEEWASVEGEKRERTTTRHYEVDAILENHDPAKFIAVYNAALPDSDPRKITREWVETLRDIAELNLKKRTRLDRLAGPCLESIANALESYLPPEWLR